MDEILEEKIGSTQSGDDGAVEKGDANAKSQHKRANQSMVWDHFHIITEKDDPNPRAACNYCTADYACHTTKNGTSAMRSHLTYRCRGYELSKKNLDKKQKTLGFEPIKGEDGVETSGKLTVVNFSVDACVKALAKMIIVDELPFKFVEGEGFRQFMRVVQPKWLRISSRVQEDEEVVKSFKDLGLRDELLEACDNLGWKQPSKIQVEAIPHGLEGKDLIGLAQTGSGKTGAFALPIIQALLETPQSFFACVLSPTRELAIQIAEQFEALGSGIGLKCAVLVGGVDHVQQSIALAKRPHIVVATPGRLEDHLSNTKGFSLRTLKYLVLDEADRLLNEDFQKAIDKILESIPRERKTYLFSATMTKKVRKLQRACLRNPVKVEASSKYSTVDTLKQQYLLVPSKHKDCYLVYLLTEMSGSSSMVFTRTCDSTNVLALILRNLGLRAIQINGQMSQAKRLGALNKFKAGECNILVCTDVASRGLDIPNVDLVINYDIPSNSKDYIHRVGRTARAGRTGVAISIVSQYEFEWYLLIENLIGKKLPKFPAQEEEVLLLLERVSEARRISEMKIKETGGKKKKRGGDEGEEDVERYSKGKLFKKSKKK